MNTYSVVISSKSKHLFLHLCIQIRDIAVEAQCAGARCCLGLVSSQYFMPPLLGVSCKPKTELTKREMYTRRSKIFYVCMYFVCIHVSIYIESSQLEYLNCLGQHDRPHALHSIVKLTQQAHLPLHQLQRLQSLQQHYSMPRTVSVATQRGHWEP